ncbi:unnamed protein product [Oikopleura dioica]|uniref:Uncharacterized protein n=1 Tax=Oikopleura dioica TaxID=34765 RepID=E4X6S7_OIKDI|nr:unnamed protein product [Oikopleura dioica]
MLSQGDTVQDAGSPMNVSVNEQDQSGTESEESSEEELTPEIIYNRLKLSWMNERIAPELLPNDEDVTENAKNLIDGMKQNLAGGRRGIADIKYSIHAFEVERTRVHT